MSYELNVGTYHGVGPIGDLFGHGLVLQIGTVPKRGDSNIVFACAECGYTHHDQRMFYHTECDRERNQINETLAERYDLE